MAICCISETNLCIASIIFPYRTTRRTVAYDALYGIVRFRKMVRRTVPYGVVRWVVQFHTMVKDILSASSLLFTS